MKKINFRGIDVRLSNISIKFLQLIGYSDASCRYRNQIGKYRADYFMAFCYALISLLSLWMLSDIVDLFVLYLNFVSVFRVLIKVLIEYFDQKRMFRSRKCVETNIKDQAKYIIYATIKIMSLFFVTGFSVGVATYATCLNQTLYTLPFKMCCTVLILIVFLEEYYNNIKQIYLRNR